ncbi:hypothetical protein SETIT_3G094600v2 [Setaria italica]|uniref:Uncharacterized protein n=2 Tax=Setaria TaxID=4554 RepID=A0A368QDE0_SETIT|nr:hypothetical protein SETIT_3G094600v2 [Setaria italica]TKW25114.1 hypothetical protein SEVIR_3G094900v2 [Setaria viridis]RCV15893.1 hypothetical protein SETIT_3G094600v2 [Setaria italica]RCV15894.1 hypothetical protein SETIT_3G094600v2 [Setaria italica]TKW25115.1 hypothetical protein SEVIR_3G094900v2 [Setaria viridis]
MDRMGKQVMIRRDALHGDGEPISLSQEWLAYLYYLVHQGVLMMDEMWMMAAILANSSIGKS